MADRKSKKRVIVAPVSAAAALIAAAAAFFIYTGDYYRADEEAARIAVYGTEGCSAEQYKGGIVFRPENPEAGLIFYPGGKVEYTAYAPLMAEIAERGFLCVLAEMPFNLAVFNMNAADVIQEMFPDITRWYVGGHSLGGAMAASYLGKQADEFEGLLLLGAYSAQDLADSGLKVVSVYGSEDKVLNREKYESCAENLPEDFSELVIEGGCHSYFGNYGMQEGDGEPFVSRGEQIEETAGFFASEVSGR